MTRPSPAIIEKLKQGWRFCGGCSNVVLDPSLEEWRKMCSVCYNGGLCARFCRDCGEPLPTDLRKWYKSKRILSAQCWPCKHGQTQPHPVWQVKVPQSWYATLSSVEK